MSIAEKEPADRNPNRRGRGRFERLLPRPSGREHRPSSFRARRGLCWRVSRVRGFRCPKENQELSFRVSNFRGHGFRLWLQSLRSTARWLQREGSSVDEWPGPWAFFHYGRRFERLVGLAMRLRRGVGLCSGVQGLRFSFRRALRDLGFRLPILLAKLCLLSYILVIGSSC